MRTDYLFIEEMKLSCHIGTTVDERALLQIVTVSLKLELPLVLSAQSERLSDTLDYAAVISEIRTLAASREFVLAEGLAENIAQITLKHPLVESVQVKIGKNIFSDIKSVGACIYRKKSNLSGNE